jgi:hypothetical protein
MPVLLLVLALVGCKTGADDPKPVDDTDDTDVDVDTRPDDTDPPEPDPEPAQTALDDLRDASTGPVTLHAEAGVVNALFATVPVDPGPPIDQALGFLEEYADLYALADPRGQLHPQRADVDEEDEDGAAHVRFMQRSLPDHGSLPVFNAGLTVHVANDTVYLTTGRYLPEVLPQPPRLSWDEALRGARFTPAIGEPEVRGEPRLGVWVRWSDVGAIGIHTVWRATISSLQADNDAPILWTVDIDAVTGNVVHVANQTTSCDRDLDIMFGFHGSSSSCWSFAATDDWFDADGELDDYSPTADHNNDGIDAFNLAHDVLGWYEGLGLCSYDDDDAEVEIVTHATIEGTIASATGICGTMQFRDDAVTLDILGHEFTHLVDYNHTDLEYEGQSGALDESFADVFGSFMDGNWTVAEGTPGGAFRSLQDPPDFGDPDHMSGSLSGDGIGLRSTTTSTDNGNVHTNSGIPNKAAWLTTVGGVHTGFDVTGIGTIRATRLYHVVHRFGMEDDARFTDAPATPSWGRRSTGRSSAATTSAPSTSAPSPTPGPPSASPSPAPTATATAPPTAATPTTTTTAPPTPTTTARASPTSCRPTSTRTASATSATPTSTATATSTSTTTASGCTTPTRPTPTATAAATCATTATATRSSTSTTTARA